MSLFWSVYKNKDIQKDSVKQFKISLMPKYLNENTTFLYFQTVLNCAVWTTAKVNGSKLKNTDENEYSSEKPRDVKVKWKICLERKVKN